MHKMETFLEAKFHYVTEIGKLKWRLFTINYNNLHYFGYLFIITVVFNIFFPKQPPEWCLAKQEKNAKQF